jgi:hypothetical protein
MIVYSYI